MLGVCRGGARATRVLVSNTPKRQVSALARFPCRLRRGQKPCPVAQRLPRSLNGKSGQSACQSSRFIRFCRFHWTSLTTRGPRMLTSSMWLPGCRRTRAARTTCSTASLKNTMDWEIWREAGQVSRPQAQGA